MNNVPNPHGCDMIVSGGLIMLTIRPASDADIPAIQSLLYDAVDRAEAMGRPMWQREHVAWEVISQKYPASTFRLAVLDGETVGCMALVMYDPEIWPELAPDEAVYLHKLVVHRNASGKGVSRALFACARDHCRSMGIPSLRLDVYANREKLCALYESEGFRFVREESFYGESYHSALYEQDVPMFTQAVSSWDDWRRVFQDRDAFTPLIRAIYRKEQLTFTTLENTAPGTNAVFRIGETVAKVFVPACAGCDSAPEYAAELDGLMRAERYGVDAPRVRASGTFDDCGTLWRYLVMDYIDAPSFADMVPTLDDAGKRTIGRRLRELTDRLHVPRADGLVWAHRDINPDNLLIRPDGTPALLDFADAAWDTVECERAVIVCELFRFDHAFLDGYFPEGWMPDALAESCIRGLARHPFRENILRDRFGTLDDPYGHIRAALL